MLLAKSGTRNKSLTRASEKEQEYNKKYLIPNLVGENFEKASSEYNVLKIDEAYSDEIPDGCIISQSPSQGSMHQNNKLITTIVSKGSEYKPLPMIIGMKIGEATSLLAEEGFIPKIKEINSENSGYPEGIVIGYSDQNLAPGVSARRSHPVFIDVSI